MQTQTDVSSSSPELIEVPADNVDAPKQIRHFFILKWLRGIPEQQDTEAWKQTLHQLHTAARSQLTQPLNKRLIKHIF